MESYTRTPDAMIGLSANPQKPRGKNMIKKLLVTVAAAGALSVPLAGVAGADPTPDNPGTPGTPRNIGGGTLAPPGSYLVKANTAPGGLSTAGTFREVFDGLTPGGFIKQFAPPNFPPTGG